jgi:hypothetical protein
MRENEKPADGRLTHKKIHSCKPLQTNAETKACKRVFFSATQVKSF